VAALAGPVAGCVLLVKPIEPESHCAIQGDTACAQCIRTKCQGSVDTCCKDATCATGDPVSNIVGKANVLEVADQCGQGSVDSCAQGLQVPRTGAASNVSTCVSNQCALECTVGPWSCASPRIGRNDCGTCIFQSCAASLDACCNDSSCGKYSNIQKEVGACTSGDTAGCAYLRSQSTSGLEGVVRGCISKSCGARCMGDGRPHQHCSLYSAGAYCSCSDAEAPSGPDCSVASVGGTCAVAKDGCACGPYACETASNGCSCAFKGGSGSTSCSVAKTTSEGRCCLKLGSTGVSCACDRTLSRCLPEIDEYSVATCNLSDVLAELRPVNRIVDTCSK